MCDTARSQVMGLTRVIHGRLSGKARVLVKRGSKPSSSQDAPLQQRQQDLGAASPSPLAADSRHQQGQQQPQQPQQQQPGAGSSGAGTPDGGKQQQQSGADRSAPDTSSEELWLSKDAIALLPVVGAAALQLAHAAFGCVRWMCFHMYTGGKFHDVCH
jgi:hypothetical protein